MPEQVIGHYMGQSKKLLKEFDQTATLLENYIVSRFGIQLASQLKEDILKEYEKLIPEIPYIPGIRGKSFNSFLLITAQELAAFKAMKKLGKTAGEAWELCHEALRLSMAKVPKWKRWLLRCFMFSPFVMTIMEKRAKRQKKDRLGDFEIEYLFGEGKDFDFGVNYLQCGNINFAKKFGGEEFVPYICMSDIALSKALGWGLTRTQTLADGCSFCDFRFKKGGSTHISSKTPEVQKTIEKINQENFS